MDYKRIESELRCPACQDLFKYPVMLPCGHNICAGCSEKCLSSVTSGGHSASGVSSVSPPHGRRPQELTALQETRLALHMSHSHMGYHDAVGDKENTGNLAVIMEDQISLASDADSGVVCGSSGNKRDSFIITGSEQGLYTLTCPSSACHKVFLTDELPGKSLPPNRLLMKILSKYTSALLSGPVYGTSSAGSTPTGHSPHTCQLCDTEPIRSASLYCQQCKIFYCQHCRDSFHPPRGPLASHEFINCTESNNTAIPPSAILQQQQLHNIYVSAALEQHKCPLHNHEYTMFCTPCRLPLCWRCLESETFHQEEHDVQSLQGLSKARKADFSRALQLLSEKSKRMTEWISRVKGASNRIPESALDVESSINAQCDLLAQLIENQKTQLLHSLQLFKEQKLRESRETATECTAALQQATAQIQFGIEVLKESEAVNFLQFSSSLYQRVAQSGDALDKMLDQTNWTPELNIRLDSRAVTHALRNLHLNQVAAPSIPRLDVERCRIINAQISLTWESDDQYNTDFYIVEVAESGNTFTRAYYGPETTCCLSFASTTMIYQARLKAVNAAGESPYSSAITLHIEGGYFTWERTAMNRDMILTNDDLTLTSTAPDDTVVLASAGFIRGVHYWEIHVDRYDNHPDPAFGVATAGVRRDTMLGKDSHGWSVYIDAARSWCFHNNQHINRMEGGIAAGCTVGILLDLDQRPGCLSFFVNDEPQAPIPAFQNLPDGCVFYPAVSINRNVQLTLRPCLEPPTSDYSSSPE